LGAVNLANIHSLQPSKKKTEPTKKAQEKRGMAEKTQGKQC